MKSTSNDPLPEQKTGTELHVDDEDDTDALWNVAQGYTPWQDCANDDETGFVFSHGVEGSVFSSLPQTVYGMMDGDDDDEKKDATSSSPIQEDATDGHGGLLSIADSVLMSLDAEYRRTISSTIPNNTVMNTLNCTIQEGVDDDEKLAPTCTIKQDPSPPIAPTTTTTDDSFFPTQDFLLPSTPTMVERKPMDKEAVLRAVATIQSRNTALQTKYTQWEQSQQTSSAWVPRLHPLIASRPLAAFRHASAKAQQASAYLSRSATLAHAIVHKFDLLRSTMECFCIHIVGCDEIECSAPERVWGPLVRWMGAYAECPRSLQLHVIGPNVPVNMTMCGHHPNGNVPSCGGGVDLLPAAPTRLQSARLQFHTGLYEEYKQQESDVAPHLIIAYNAGIWGYDSWKVCVEALRGTKTPFVCTAYTLEEAEDDYEVLQSLGCTRCVWEPELNPFGSRIQRETHTAPQGRCYRENAAWQGWLL